MKGLAPLIGILFLIALAIKYWWIVLIAVMHSIPVDPCTRSHTVPTSRDRFLANSLEYPSTCERSSTVHT